MLKFYFYLLGNNRPLTRVDLITSKNMFPTTFITFLERLLLLSQLLLLLEVVFLLLTLFFYLVKLLYYFCCRCTFLVCTVSLCYYLVQMVQILTVAQKQKNLYSLVE